MPSELSPARHIGGKPRARPSDLEIGHLAKRQHGIVSRDQLRGLGLGEDAIDTRLRSGRLCQLHRGVYAVGHELVSREGHWLAAVYRGGASAVLSHSSAAALWGIRRRGQGSWIDVSLPRSTCLPTPIRRHVIVLESDEITERRRIPVTTLTRTLFDVAADCSPEGLDAVIREAEYRHRFQIRRLEDFLEKRPGRRGANAIRASLERLGRGPQGHTRSRLEVRFASLLARTDLPRPALNALLDLGGKKIETDCLWRKQRLIVELDGGRSHGTRSAFETDRERDRRLQAEGWRVIRVTWYQLDNSAELIADLRRLLR